MVRRLSLDLGDFRDLLDRSVHAHQRWNSHGDALVMTLAKNAGIQFDRKSLRLMSSWGEWRSECRGYDLLTLNVRSYTYPMAKKAAEIFKAVNPKGVVVTGGTHPTVAMEEMEAVEAFDYIVVGNSEKSFVGIMMMIEEDQSGLVEYPVGGRMIQCAARVIQGEQFRGMDDWPIIDRTFWPKPGPLQEDGSWPLEPACGWGPGPVATMLTSRVCPWACSFCNESSYIQSISRRSVDSVIGELNELDDKYGPIGSVVFHDSMFFQQPRWLNEFLEKYPRDAHKPWPYWAAARSDTVHAWPELFERLVRETNWHTVSIGFESGSDNVLKILNKECTVADNNFTIDLLNDIGDDLESRGQIAPKFFANIILAIPGESREDAFATVQMLKRMKRVLPSLAYYAPYPGSALGYQLTAEGKSLMTSDNYHRFPGQEKVKGVDYRFYADLLNGKYDRNMRAMVAAQGGDGVYWDKRGMFNLKEELVKA